MRKPAGTSKPDRKSRLARALPVLALLLPLSACVTTSTGGFSARASEEEALRDYLQLSRGYLEQGDLANTRRHLQNAQSIDSNNGEVHGTWGLLYARQGDDRQADESFRRALRLDPANSQVRNNYAAFLYSRGQYEEAYTQLRQVVEDTDYRARTQAFLNLGLAARRLGRLDQAEQAFSRALRLDGNFWLAALELTDLHLEREAAEQARGYYQDYLRLSEYYNIAPTARSLWTGVRLERALGNEAAARQYGEILRSLFEGSREHQLYLQSLSQ